MIDILVFSYLIIAFIRICCLFFACALICTTFALSHFSELNFLLEEFTAKYRPSQGWQPTDSLQFYIAEHITSSMIVAKANRGLWDLALLVAFICQIPSNIHLMSRVLLEPKTLLLWYIMAMQFGILIGICVMCAGYTKAIHAGSKIVPRIQALLPRSSLQLKLKTLGVFELLTSERKIGLSIGSITTVTNSVVFQVSIDLSLFGVLTDLIFLFKKIFGAYIAYVLILLQFFLT